MLHRVYMGTFVGQRIFKNYYSLLFTKTFFSKKQTRQLVLDAMHQSRRRIEPFEYLVSWSIRLNERESEMYVRSAGCISFGGGQARARARHARREAWEATAKGYGYRGNISPS